MTETEALRMMVETLFCNSSDIDEDLKVIDYYTKTHNGRVHLKKIYEEHKQYISFCRGGDSIE